MVHQREEAAVSPGQRKFVTLCYQAQKNNPDVMNKNTVSQCGLRALCVFGCLLFAHLAGQWQHLLCDWQADGEV